MKRRHANHGWLHRPGGPDPARPGPQHLIGASGEPAFENGWDNIAAGGDIPNPTPMFYRLVIGPPNVMDEDGNIVQYTEHVIEIAGDVTGGDDGTVVFTLPAQYTFPKDRAYSSHDSTGIYVPGRLYSNGEFVRGIA